MPFGNNLENTLLKGPSTLKNPMVSQPNSIKWLRKVYGETYGQPTYGKT
jgi:hypothetical protein